MPNIEFGDYTQDKGTVFKEDHGYDYPDGVNLKPGTSVHKKLLDHVMQRARISHGIMSAYHPKWNEIDRVLTSYVDLTDKEKEIQGNDKRKPVSIVVPHSYAILESTLSYMISAFFQEPIFRFEGTDPNSIIGAIMLTKVIDLHCNKTNVPLNLHTMFRDNFTYSFGVVAPGWEIKYGTRARKVERLNAFAKMFGKNKVDGYNREIQEDVVLFEGNKLTNIDPYTAMPDPNYPIYEARKSEFFGWSERTNLYDLLSEEKHSDGDVFNVKYLKQMTNRTSFIHRDASGRNDRIPGRTKEDTAYTKPLDCIKMFVKIIPKEFKLSSNEYPEIYYIVIAADEVIVECRPVGTYDTEIPIEVCCSEYDGYGVCPISRLELLYGMQHTIDWMFSSHIHNVRKALNDVLIVDPFLLNLPDLENGAPGGVARLRRPAWGRAGAVKDSVQQLNIHDVTQNHVRDVGVLMQFMDRISSIDGSASGTLRQGGPERLTGQEFQGTRQATLNRLERVAKIISMQALKGIATQFASHTQQLMNEEIYIDVFGSWQDQLISEFGITDPQNERIKVSPYDLLVDYNIKMRDGSIPGNNSSAQALARMFEVIIKEPELRNTFDIVRIFKHIARNDGAKNVDNFVKIKVAPDQQVMDQAQAGNMIGLDEAGIAV